MAEPWKLTLPCTREEAEALPDDAFAAHATAPVLVASEDNAGWRLDAYFDGKPSRDLLRAIHRLLPSARRREPRAKPLPREDWVTLSQAGLEPVTAGRFRVRTPDHHPARGMVDLVIPAGLAFGTGQHATTAGCLAMLDGLKGRGAHFRDLLDLGSGSGVLAFAAMKLWPCARATASDIDPVAVAVLRDNAALNGVRPGRGPGRLRAIAADGFAEYALVRRAPYDLVIANILAAPLIDLSAYVAASLAPRGMLILAGLLDSQADAVARAYRRQGLRLVRTGGGEWPVFLMRRR